MPSEVTISDLITRLEEETDIQNSAFFSTDEKTRFITAACNELYDIILLANGFDYYITETDLVTVAGTRFVDLPDDFYKFLGIDWIDETPPVALQKMSFDDRNRYYLDGWSSNSATPGYILKSTSVWLIPTPAAVHNLRLFYVPVFSFSGVGADTFDAINGWEDYVVYSAAVRVCNKEERDPGPFMQGLASTGRRIEAMGYIRDIGHGAKYNKRHKFEGGNRWGII